MQPSKNTLMVRMIEEKYGSKIGVLTRSVSRQLMMTKSGKSRESTVIKTIKNMVGLTNPRGDFPTKSGIIRKWKNTCSRFGKRSSDDDTESVTGERFDNVGWWEPPQDSFPVEFCQDTSLHGLKYIGQSRRHLSERIFWFITFTIGLSVAVWLISAMWSKYKQNPVIVSFQPFETNVDQVPFPAVTVCNMNKVMKSQAESFKKNAALGNKKAIQELYYMDHVCSSTQSFSRRFNFTWANDLTDDERELYNFTAAGENLTKVNEFLSRAAQNCSEMLRLCVWDDQEIDCPDIFRPIETEYGKCCTFNMIPLSLIYTKRNDSRESPREIRQWEKWDIDKDGLLLSTDDSEETQFPRRQTKAGLTNGLSFLLNVDSSQYYCTSSDSVGFRVNPGEPFGTMAAHLPVELPKIADYGISLRPGSEIFVDVNPQLTMSDPAIFSFALEQRNCYKNHEYDLAYFKYYSVNNCIDECIANETKLICGCKRYYMPRNVKEALCGPRKFDCAEDVRHNKTKYGIRNTCPMCFQSCTEVVYDTQTTSTALRKGLWKFANGSMPPNWREDDLSIVHVYIGQDSFYAKVRKELYGPTDLFANTGGLMGLCLGFSGLSLVEVIYFLTLRAWWKHRRNRAVQTKDDNFKWATHVPPVSTISSPRRMLRRRGREDTKTTAYFKSVFGELRLNRDQ